MSAALEIETLHKTYKNGTEALKGISLKIEKGEFFGLLGPNGSGKTTMINCVAGPVKKTSGEIKVSGKNIDEYRQETKMMLGVVPQEISFDSFFTVNETMILQSGYYGVKDNQKYIDEILEKLNLMDKKHTNTRALSGGMKRRLLVAKALVHKPKVLILDEPTAGVDIELRRNLWEYMRKLNKEGLTILLTTHYIEEAEALCGRVAIIDKGKLAALDKTSRLKKSLGNKKRLILTFDRKIERIPPTLEKFHTKKLSDYEISVKFEPKDLHKVLDTLKNIDLPITDIDLKAKKLEDVFVELTYKNHG